MKIYLAANIATIGEATDSIRIANNLRELGYDVYAAAENKRINDKRNNPTPMDIYNGDINEIINSDIFVVNITGGSQDGTISEIGFVSGWNECITNTTNCEHKRIPIVAFTTNTRLLNTQITEKGISSASASHLVMAYVEKWGEFVKTEEDLIRHLDELINISNH